MNGDTEVQETALQHEHEHDQVQDQDWIQFLQLTADVGSDLGQLMLLELQLAMGNLARMLLLALAAVPLVLLGWIALSMLPAVAVYQHTDSAVSGVALFLLIQMLALGAVCVAWVRYSRTLSLPRTRRQFRAFTGEAR